MANELPQAATNVQSDAAYHLRHHQKQADADGCLVTVSRQALDEVLDELTALRIARIEARGCAVMWARQIDGSWHACAKGDPGAVRFEEVRP